MAQIIQNISVEVSKPNFFAAIVAKQYDSGSRFLKATFIHDGKKVSIPSTSTVTINAKRSDGNEKPFNGEVNDDGTVTVPLTYWMLEIAGTLKCDISIFDADESKLTSTDFIVDVQEASCANPDVTDSNKYDILVLQGTNIVGSVNGKTGVVNLTPADIGTMDYIVEQGVSGNWIYRKWNSGIAECFGSVQTKITTEDKGGYYAQTIDTLGTFPSGLFVGGSLFLTCLAFGSAYPAINGHKITVDGFGVSVLTKWAVTDGDIWVHTQAVGRWK